MYSDSDASRDTRFRDMAEERRKRNERHQRDVEAQAVPVAVEAPADTTSESERLIRDYVLSRNDSRVSDLKSLIADGVSLESKLSETTSELTTGERDESQLHDGVLMGKASADELSALRGKNAVLRMDAKRLGELVAANRIQRDALAGAILADAAQAVLPNDKTQAARDAVLNAALFKKIVEMVPLLAELGHSFTTNQIRGHAGFLESLQGLFGGGALTRLAVDVPARCWNGEDVFSAFNSGREARRVRSEADARARSVVRQLNAGESKDLLIELI